MYLAKGLSSLLAILLIFIAQTVQAQGPAVLTIIHHDNKQIRFDIAALEAMDTLILRTSTPWSDGVQTFTGVRLSQLLADIGAQHHDIEAQALNNYKTGLDWNTLANYPVIIAFKRNGQPMRIRDKGPLWIIYPLDDYPELRTLNNESKMVWQLHRLVVR
ncbi:molybdopterin-dependent oxidoreductase [Zobellella aerophila]|uniref:Oxidoreductase molybdopterin-binding domain-containing protein n=1 Tax=Zobellella aerophila TaxID=870480 RepID=A0ABP6VKZ2_9GAMM